MPRSTRTARLRPSLADILHSSAPGVFFAAMGNAPLVLRAMLESIIGAMKLSRIWPIRNPNVHSSWAMKSACFPITMPIISLMSVEVWKTTTWKPWKSKRTLGATDQKHWALPAFILIYVYIICIYIYIIYIYIYHMYIYIYISYI